MCAYVFVFKYEVEKKDDAWGDLTMLLLIRDFPSRQEVTNIQRHKESFHFYGLDILEKEEVTLDPLQSFPRIFFLPSFFSRNVHVHLLPQLQILQSVLFCVSLSLFFSLSFLVLLLNNFLRVSLVFLQKSSHSSIFAHSSQERKREEEKKRRERERHSASALNALIKLPSNIHYSLLVSFLVYPWLRSTVNKTGCSSTRKCLPRKPRKERVSCIWWRQTMVTRIGIRS